jgi:uncharacterized protein YggT (Ycf19 family)
VTCTLWLFEAISLSVLAEQCVRTWQSHFWTHDHDKTLTVSLTRSFVSFPPFPPHTLFLPPIYLCIDTEHGLTNKEAAARLAKFGTNELNAGEKVNPWKILAGNVFNSMNGILALALLFSAIAKDIIEAVVVSIVIVTNTYIGFRQEYSSEKTMEALRKMSSPTARVIRESDLSVGLTTEVVPGDIVYME